MRPLDQARPVDGVVFEDMHSVADRDGSRVDLPRPAIDMAIHIRDSAHRIGRGQADDDGRDIPSIRARRPGDRGGRGGGRRIDCDALRMLRLHEPRDIRGEIVHDMGPLIESERARIREPRAAIDSI